MNPSASSPTSCKALGCFKTTVLGIRYCREHLTAVQSYADPFGKALKPSEYTTERLEVSELLHAHRDHVAVHTTLRYLTDWLGKASLGQDCPALVEVQRLAEAGVTAMDVFTEALALYVYAARNPQSLSMGSQPFMYQLANAVMRLAPRPSSSLKSEGRFPIRASEGNRKNLGRHLMTLLDHFYPIVTHGASDVSEDSRETLEAQPLEEVYEPTVSDLWQALKELPGNLWNRITRKRYGGSKSNHAEANHV